MVSLLLYGLVNLLHYEGERKRAQDTTLELQRLYESTPVPSEADNFELSANDFIEQSAEISNAENQRDMFGASNDQAALFAEKNQSGDIQSLREKNEDIIGWLSIDGMLEEPVVQRDNEFYMGRDALKRTNANGAIFLDALFSLEDQSDTLVLYGHNMRSGARFGSLWKYEDYSFYRSHPFITFDHMYQKAQYVIFSTGVISTNPQAPNFVDYLALHATNIYDREKAIQGLIQQSLYDSHIEVQPEDLLLLLITCVDKEDERRFVASRCIREDESKKELQKNLSNTVTQ